MLLLISPAKTLDFDTPPTTTLCSQPRMLDKSKQLIDLLRPMTPDTLASLMKLSDKLASLNAARFGQWQPPFDLTNAKQALFAFKGDVYTGLKAEQFTETQLQFAQQHLRILSGLFGVLRPLDLMQPYRLEMGTRIANHAGNDLYSFWGSTITEELNAQLDELNSDSVINLASTEYFKAVKSQKLRARLITPVFKDRKNGQYKIISFYAKKARGLMSRYAICNALTNPEDLKSFDLEGYQYADDASDKNTWVFLRDQP